jgi:uncharacterized protein
MKRFIFFITALLLVISLSNSALALEVPPKPLGRISDYTDTLSTSQIRELDAILEKFEQDTTNQIAVVLIPTLEGDNLEDYSIRLAEKWKIGQEGKDNGVIVLIIKQDRKIRIEVGYGLEGVLPDSLAGDIIRNTLAPYFRRNDFSGGIEKAIQRIISATKGEYKAPDSQKRPIPRDELVDLIKILLCFLVLFFIVIRGAIRDFLYRRKQATRLKKGGFHGDMVGYGSSGGFFGGGFGGGFSGGGGGFGGGGASGGW